MGRRKEDGIGGIIDVMTMGPIWLGPVLAAAVFLLVRFLVPALLGGAGQIGSILIPIVKQVSPFLAGGMIFLWLLSLAKRFSDRRRFDNHPDKATIRQLSWRQFESYVGEAFRRQGYAVEERGDPAGDGGVDLVLRKDGQTTLVQCKHWKAFKVGVQPVRELLGVISSEGAQAGVVVTSGRFTAEATEFARANRIRLIDGDGMEDIVRSIRLPDAATSASKQMPSASVATSSKLATSVLCPRCGGPMVTRTARRGAGAGEQFWGCQAYPRCKGTLPMAHPAAGPLGQDGSAGRG